MNILVSPQNQEYFLQIPGHPGVYMVSCKCEKRYVGETKLKVSTRIKQHERTIKDKKWDSSEFPSMQKPTKRDSTGKTLQLLKIEDRRFDCKVREALEIQFRETPRNEHGLNQDDGQYAMTTFCCLLYTSPSPRDRG